MKPEQDALLEQLYRKYFHVLQVHAYRFLGNWADAHVAAQETFHIACDKIETVMSHPNPVGWLKNVTKNVSRNMIRTRQHQLLLFSSLDELLNSEIPSVCDETADDPTELFQELLTQEDRYLLKRIILDGISYADAGMELGINMWACRKRVQRATEKLRRQYKQEGTDESKEKVFD